MPSFQSLRGAGLHCSSDSLQPKPMPIKVGMNAYLELCSSKKFDVSLGRMAHTDF